MKIKVLVLSTRLYSVTGHAKMAEPKSRWVGSADFGRVACGKESYGGKFDKSKVGNNIIPVNKNFDVTIDVKASHTGSHYLRYACDTDKAAGDMSDSDWKYLKLANSEDCASSERSSTGSKKISYQGPTESCPGAIMEWLWVVGGGGSSTGCSPTIPASNVFRDCADVQIGDGESETTAAPAAGGTTAPAGTGGGGTAGGGTAPAGLPEGAPDPDEDGSEKEGLLTKKNMIIAGVAVAVLLALAFVCHSRGKGGKRPPPEYAPRPARRDPYASASRGPYASASRGPYASASRGLYASTRSRR